MKRSLLITKEKKNELAEKLLLYKMGVEKRKFPILLSGEDKPLETFFTFMMTKDWVKIEDESFYALTEKGQKKLTHFQNLYKDYLMHYDIYCAVDLQEGEFAFDSFEDFEESQDEEWKSFLCSPRFSDVRIAVAEYREEHDIVGMIFLFLLHEGRFEESQQKSGWQFDLALGSLWEEIEKIYENSIDYKDLGYEDDEEGAISYEDVLEDIIEQGEMILKKIHNE